VTTQRTPRGFRRVRGDYQDGRHILVARIAAQTPSAVKVWRVFGYRKEAIKDENQTKDIARL
jgi:hypothetical protein